MVKFRVDFLFGFLNGEQPVNDAIVAMKKLDLASA